MSFVLNSKNAPRRFTNGRSPSAAPTTPTRNKDSSAYQNSDAELSWGLHEDLFGPKRFNDRQLMTADIANAEIIRLEGDCRDSMTQTLKVAVETDEIGRLTAEKLDMQGEQIDRIHRDVDSISHNLDTSQYLLNGMKSWWGSLRQLVATPPAAPDFLRSSTAPCAGDSTVASRSVGSTTLSNEESRGHTSAQMYFGFLGSLMGRPAEDSSEELRNGSSKDLNGDRSSANLFKQQRSPQFQKVKNLDAEINDDLDQLSEVLSGMHSRAVQMGESIGSQNQKLDTIHTEVDRNNIRVVDQRRQIERFMGKR